MAKRKKRKNTQQKNQEIIYYIVALISIAIIIISVFQFGSAGLILDVFFKNIFGNIPYYFIMIQLLCFFGYILVQGKVLSFKSRYVIGSLFFMLGLMLLFGCIDATTTGFDVIDLKNITQSKLGLLQMLLYGSFSQLFGLYGTGIFAIVILIIALIIYFMISVSTVIQNKHNDLSKIAEEQKHKRIARQQAKLEKQKIENEKKKVNFFEIDNNEEKENEEEKNSDDFEIIDNNDQVINNEETDNNELPFDDSEIVFDDEEKEIEISKNIKLNAKDYVLPSFDLLKNPKTHDANQVNKRNANEKAKLLIDFLKEFNLDVNVSKINIGPSVTKFELTLSAGIRVNRIASMADDIKMALAVKEMRIEAPIPGKSAVGIEIPNVKNSLITLKEVLNDIDYENENKLVIGLGKDINGKSIYTSLDKMPHLLVAGATGSGKSVCINSIIVSILMNAHYNEVKLLLIDPKKVELNIYNDIPHLITPVVSDPKAASIALRRIVEEMDQRYQIFSNHNCKNISTYNKYAEKFNEKVADEELKLEKLPYIVVIIDELADLMMVSPKDVEECIMRITQMARAAGIHLIVATQRPSTDVITGVIKANIPSRIAFAVSSSIDSRTILDMVGAEKLLGKGDMLFFPSGVSSPQRVQGAFLSDDEVSKIVYAIKKQNILTLNNESFHNLEESSINEKSSGSDELYFEIEDYVKKQETISTSKLQRQFSLGYNRAAKIIDELENNGIISARRGSKPRDVLVRNEELE
ncbi:S-DNA-T family DNA segregation ATPase FtsK/SpoIIIE [Bacilli bacterium PM5-3]|nr:S-DNA-T family DNA segregation ATPase FtsK/SpoIIIE [Bacilli bacterium PM5-3]